jgi:phospholipid transport system substrate-binding protein
MKSILHVMATGLALMTITLAIAADSSPETLVKSTVDEVMAVIKQNKNKRALHELAEQKVVPHFDFSRMTQLAVGAGWRQANPVQQQALENGFRTLLIDTYTTALSVSASGNETVEIKPAQAKPDNDEVTVKTLVKERGKEPVTIDYRMENSAGGWKVFDVVVENLSLVTNYRGTFAAEINRSGIDGLIKILEEKNRANAAHARS